MHWAFNMIGLSYAECGGCWGMVQRVFAEQLGVQMPAIGVGSEEQQHAAIKTASQASGWKPAEGDARQWDIMLMRAPDGRRHVGVVVHANGELGLLHCREALGVEWTPLWQLSQAGYMHPELWRRA